MLFDERPHTATAVDEGDIGEADYNADWMGFTAIDLSASNKIIEEIVMHRDTHPEMYPAGPAPVTVCTECKARSKDLLENSPISLIAHDFT